MVSWESECGGGEWAVVAGGWGGEESVWVWVNESVETAWGSAGAEGPREAAAYSHSPPDQSLADYNARRRAEFRRRSQRYLARLAQLKLPDPARLADAHRRLAQPLVWPDLPHVPRPHASLSHTSLPQHQPSQPPPKPPSHLPRVLAALPCFSVDESSA